MTAKPELVNGEAPDPKETISELSSDSSTSLISSSSSSDISDSDSDSSDGDEGENSDILQAILQELSLSLSSSTVTGLSSNKDEKKTRSADKGSVPDDNDEGKATADAKGPANEPAQLDQKTATVKSAEERLGGTPDEDLDGTKKDKLEKVVGDTKAKAEFQNPKHGGKGGKAAEEKKRKQDSSIPDILVPVASSFSKEPDVIGPPQCRRSPKDSGGTGEDGKGTVTIKGVNTGTDSATATANDTGKTKFLQRNVVKKESTKSSAFSLLPSFNMFRCTNPNQIANNVNGMEIIEATPSEPVEALAQIETEEEEAEVHKVSSRLSMKNSRSTTKGTDTAGVIHDRDPSAVVHGNDLVDVDGRPPISVGSTSSAAEDNLGVGAKQKRLAAIRKNLPSTLSSSASTDVSSALPPSESNRRNRSSPASISVLDDLEEAVNASQITDPTMLEKNPELQMQSITEEAGADPTSNDNSRSDGRQTETATLQELKTVTVPSCQGKSLQDVPHISDQKDGEDTGTVDKKETKGTSKVDSKDASDAADNTTVALAAATPDLEASKMDSCYSVTSTLSTDSSQGSQPGVKLRSRIKGWTGGKKRKKQGFGWRQANEPDDATASDSISTISASPKKGKSASNRPRRRRKKKKKKNNLLRSLANYVRSKPTLPVISEDPDHRDEEDETTLEAATVNDKNEASDANASDFVSSSTSKLETESAEDIAKQDSKNQNSTSEQSTKEDTSKQVSFEQDITQQESVKKDRELTEEDDSTRVKSTSEPTQSGHTATSDLQSSWSSGPSHDKGTPVGVSKEAPSPRGSDSTPEILQPKHATSEPKTRSKDEEEPEAQPEKHGSELGTELTLEMVNMHHNMAARSLDSPFSTKSNDNPNDQKINVGYRFEDRQSTEIAEEQDGFCITLKVSEQEDEIITSPSQRILEELEMIEPHHSSSHSSPRREAEKQAGKKIAPERRFDFKDKKPARVETKGRHVAEGQPAPLTPASNNRNESRLPQKHSAIKAARSPIGDRHGSEERENWEAVDESGHHTNGPLLERKEKKSRRVFPRSFFGKKNGKVQPAEAFTPQHLQPIPQYMPPPGELEKWRSVEKKIEASLKKAEALASVYGEDIDDLLKSPRASAEFSRTSTEVSRTSTEFSPITEISRISTELSVAGFSIPEPASEEWMSVERKIDDSLMKVEKLASRLGISRR